MVDSMICKESDPDCNSKLSSGNSPVRLIALKNYRSVITFPNKNYIKGRSTTWLRVYDVESHTSIFGGADPVALGPDYIIKLGYSMDGSTVLQLYRPGMGSFENIMPSFLSNTTGDIENTWTELSEDGHVESLPIVFSGEQITAYHHRYRYTGVNRKYELLSVAPITFDLQTVDIRPISGS